MPFVICKKKYLPILSLIAICKSQTFNFASCKNLEKKRGLIKKGLI